MDPLDHTHFHSVIRAGAASLPRTPEMRILSPRSYGMAVGFHLVIVIIMVIAALLKPKANPPIALEAEIIIPGLTLTPIPSLDPERPILPAESSPNLFAQTDSPTISKGQKNLNPPNPQSSPNLAATPPSDAAGQRGLAPLPSATKAIPIRRDPWEFSPQPPKLATASDNATPTVTKPSPAPVLSDATKTATSQSKSPQPSSSLVGPKRDHIAAAGGGSEGTVLVAPLPIYNPKPPYPKLAESQGLTGVVVIRVLVSTKGTIIRTEIVKSSGSHMLDEAARRGVMEWKFNPGRQASGAVNTAIDIPIDFTLDDIKGSAK
ncbi:MAG: TonB family protein [Candidatus Pacebacteria bacterium]|nr:TonB family protein [Candidatus Paceibacterota bacterium]